MNWGPLLFVIYINNIVDGIKNGKCYLYADDLAVVYGNCDTVMVQQLLQADLDSIGEWCNKYQLTINTAKTKVLWCYSDRDKTDYSCYNLIMKNETGGEGGRGVTCRVRAREKQLLETYIA